MQRPAAQMRSRTISLRDFHVAFSPERVDPIVTAHPGVDHDTVLKRARLVIDLRGIARVTLVENVVRP